MSSKEWRERNREILRIKKRAYYLENKAKWQTPEIKAAKRLRAAQRRAAMTPDERTAFDRRSYLLNRETSIACAKRWQANNREKKRAYDKKRHEENRPAMLEKARRNYEKNRHKWQTYYQERKDRFRELSKAWRAANPEKVIAATNRRRVRLENGSSVGVTPAEWRVILEQFGNLCAYCRKPNGSKRLERDHVIPVSKGGLDNPDNVVPACRTCNAKKAARLDWRPST